MKSKGEAGEHLCTNPPYGYRKDPENKKRWIIDPEAAEVVKRIFALCLDGYGPSKIARILKEDKVITPTIHFQQTGRAARNAPPDNPYHWTGDTIADILERPEYKGHTVNFKKMCIRDRAGCVYSVLSLLAALAFLLPCLKQLDDGVLLSLIHI